MPCLSGEPQVKCLFLDIDGVLNSGTYFKTLKDRISQGIGDESSLQQYASGMMDPDAIHELNRIVRETGAVVVISSTWRHAHPLTHISRMLRFRGFNGAVIGATPDLPHGYNTSAFEKFLSKNPGHWTADVRCRGNEIQAWLDVVPVESFVILDDDSDMAHLEPFFVKTLNEFGLLSEHADKAIRILNGN
jgi:hypothetical protein